MKSIRGIRTMQAMQEVQLFSTMDFLQTFATGIHVITNTTQPSLNNFFDGGDFFDC